MIKCPCEQCVCLAICRHKTFPELFIDCDMIRKYEPHYKDGILKRSHMLDIERILQPTIWKLYRSISRYYVIDEIVERTI